MAYRGTKPKAGIFSKGGTPGAPALAPTAHPGSDFFLKFFGG
jgi:hypothetical protein